jgi:hypothetical protein
LYPAADPPACGKMKSVSTPDGAVALDGIALFMRFPLPLSGLAVAHRLAALGETNRRVDDG